MVLGKSHFVYHFKLSPALSSASTCHACYLKFCHKEDHRGIEKIVEVKGCHVSLLATSSLESRDEIPVRGVDL